MEILDRNFFNRPTEAVARELLGKYLVRRIGDRVIAAMITETEAYDGFKDKGSHAYRGKTKRNQLMFGPAGNWYVYFTYGRHWMLNIVTREKDYPGAVLIRGVAGVSGPGRVAKFFQIDGGISGLRASPALRLWLENRGMRVPPGRIKRSARIGIDYAGPYWSKRKWRFLLLK
ncbi:MAG: DNA-3-methyladenine glycosylase [Candidatus Liptonbacteria bacterium]